MMIANVSFVNNDDRHMYTLDEVLSFNPYSLEDVKTGMFVTSVTKLLWIKPRLSNIFCEIVTRFTSMLFRNCCWCNRG